MKKRFVIIFLGAAILFIAFKPNSPPNAETYSPQHDQVKELFQSSKESTAKDAIWTSSSIFKVGVVDDGTRRDGYAEYVCQVLYDYGFKGEEVWVQIIDIVKLTRDGDWVKIGETRCQ